MNVLSVTLYIKKVLSNQISVLNGDHQVEHGIDEYEDIDNIVETVITIEQQQICNKQENIELINNQAYSSVVLL